MNIFNFFRTVYPLFSEKQPLILLSGLFIFQKLVYDRLWLFVYNQIFKEGVTILL